MTSMPVVPARWPVSSSPIFLNAGLTWLAVIGNGMSSWSGPLRVTPPYTPAITSENRQPGWTLAGVGAFYLSKARRS